MLSITLGIQRPMGVLVARLAVYIFVLCCGALQGTLWTTARAEEPVDIDAVDVEAPAVQDRYEPAAMAHAVDLDTPRALGEELGDVLRRIPGVVVRSFGSVLQPQSVQLRGAASQQVVVEVEGIRLNSLSHGGFDLAMLPLAAFDRAVVTRGAGSLEHGSGAEGGVIALELRRPDGEGAFADVRAGGGSFATAQTEASAGARFSGVEVGGGLAYAHSEGEFDFVDAQNTTHSRINNDGDRVGAYLTGAVGRMGRPRLALTALGTWLERGAPGPSEFQTRFADARTQDTQLAIGLSGQLPGVLETEDMALDLTASTSYLLSQSTYDNPRALLGGTEFVASNLEHRVDPAVEASVYLGDWSVTTVLLAMSHQRLERELGSRDTFERTVLAATIAQEFSLWNDALRAIAGVRLEAPVDGPLVAIPRVGAVARVSDFAALHINLGRAYRLPTFDELHMRQEFVRGNPDLSVEDAFQADIGLRVRPTSWMWLEASLFLIDYDRLILFVPSSGFFFQATNLAGATSRGAELTAAAAPWSWAKLEASYAYNDARFAAQPQDPLPGRPAHTFRVALTTPVGPVTPSVEARWVGERFVDNFGNRSIPGALWLDASIAWDIDQSWQVAVRGTNLANTNNAVDALQRPLPGLGVFGTVSWRSAWDFD